MQIAIKSIDAVVKQHMDLINPQAQLPVEITPKLAHLVLCVPDIEKALRFYRDGFGYAVVASAPELGAVFLSAGNDHHTIGLVQSLPRGFFSKIIGAFKFIPIIKILIAKRCSARRSIAGQKITIPPLSVAKTLLRPGLQHIAFRVNSEKELKAYYTHFKKQGIKVEWTINHDQLTKSLYVNDGSGNICELFIDLPDAKQLIKQAQQAGGFHHLEPRHEELNNYDLDLEEELIY